MSDVAERLSTPVAEYLAWEREQADKHELHDGHIYAMAGGSPRHNLLAGAAAAELRAATRSSGCVTLSSDQRIAAPAGERYVYADAVVVCGRVEMQADAADVLLNPSVIVEVLSPSTEAHDRGLKWAAYQRLSSLTDFLMLAQDRVRIEHYRRDVDGWHYRECGPGETLRVAGAELSVDAIYAGAFELPGA